MHKYAIFGDKVMIYEKLQKIGLTEKEAKIYTALLELGETNIQRISKKSKIKRTTIYNIINILKEKGLVSTILKKKRKYYMASDPRDIEFRLEEQRQVLKNLMPELLSITNLIDKKPKIKYYEGYDGIKEIFINVLNYPNQPVWGWATEDVFTDFFDKDFLDYFISQRIKNKIMTYAIAKNRDKIKEYKKTDEQSLRKIKISYSEFDKFEVEIDMFGNNKIAIMSFAEKFGLIIESQKLYNTLKGIFDVSWNNLE